MQEHWREWLARALSRVLKRPVSFGEAATILGQLDAHDLGALDQALRYGARYMDLARPAKGMVRLTMVDNRDQESEAFLFTAACDTNGFIREQAIVAFGHWPGKLATAIALIRADDWVPQVRDAGTRLLELSVLSTGGGELFDHIELVMALKDRIRFANRIWPVSIEPALLHASNANRRWQATRHGKASVRLFAYSLIARADPERLNDACLEAATSTDPGVARWAIKTGAQSLSRVDFVELTRSALVHPHGSVRAEALRQLASIDLSSSFETIDRALFDKSRSARNVAAYLMRTNFHIDPIDRWRQALDTDSAKRACIAIEGLADFAQPEDADRLLPWMTHKKATIRAAALRALSRTNSPRLPEILRVALGDETTAVVKEALATYKRNPELFSKELLRCARTSAANERVESLLMRSAPLLGKWEALETCLSWYLECDPSRHRLLQVELDGWHRLSARRFTPLNDVSRARITQMLSALRGKQPANDWDDIEHAVLHS